MTSILDNPGRLSRFLAQSGYRKANNVSVAPYIIERKLSRKIKAYLLRFDIDGKSIGNFDHALKKMKAETLTKLNKAWEYDPGIETIKEFFKGPKHKTTYNDYKL